MSSNFTETLRQSSPLSAVDLVVAYGRFRVLIKHRLATIYGVSRSDPEVRVGGQKLIDSTPIAEHLVRSLLSDDEAERFIEDPSFEFSSGALTMDELLQTLQTVPDQFRTWSRYSISRNLVRHDMVSILQSHRNHLESPRRATSIDGWRHNLTQIERRQLAEMVRDHIKGDVDACEILAWLNDHEAGRGVCNALEGVIDDLHYATDCDHFCFSHDAVEGSSGHRTVCRSCVANGDFVHAEDISCYIPERDVYFSDHADAYYSDEDMAPENQMSEDPEDPEDLHDYSTDVLNILRGPLFDSTPDGDFTIGVELEVEADDRHDFVETMYSRYGTKLICKRDGSLDDDDGVELVTRPMSTSEAIELFKDMRFPGGTIAWNAGVCGMHVHIDSRAFTEESLARFMSFWNDAGNLKLIRAVAGRHPTKDEQAAAYAALEDMDFNEDCAIKRMKKCTAGTNRFRVVNLCNLRRRDYERLGLEYAGKSVGDSGTIELRVFRASLRKARLLAQIEMASASVHFARTETSKQDEKAFTSWLKKNTEAWPHLAEFLGVEPEAEQEEGVGDYLVPSASQEV